MFGCSDLEVTGWHVVGVAPGLRGCVCVCVASWPVTLCLTPVRRWADDIPCAGVERVLVHFTVHVFRVSEGMRPTRTVSGTLPATPGGSVSFRKLIALQRGLGGGIRQSVNSEHPAVENHQVEKPGQGVRLSESRAHDDVDAPGCCQHAGMVSS